MLARKHLAPQQDLRAPLLLLILCMIPVSCSSKETMSITEQHMPHLNYGDLVEFHSLPNSVANSEISVQYLCTRPCMVHVDVVASSELRTGISVFKKRWKNDGDLHEIRTRRVNVTFPSIIIYKNDYFMQHSIHVYYVMLRAWVVHADTIDTDTKHSETILYAAAKTFAVLDSIPPHQRPYKDHQKCLSWDFAHMWRARENRIPVCPFETDLVKILGFPFASSSKHNGIIKKFEGFENRELEVARQQHVDYPMFTFSVWMYLLRHCTSHLCGIIHHVDTNNLYASPLLFLTAEGRVHIQMHLVSGTDLAVLTNFKVPLYNWFRLDFTLYGKQIITAIRLGKPLKSYGHQVYNFDEEIYSDDSDGYIVLGGSKHVQGIDGFFGPVKYYRLRALESDEIFNPLLEDQIYDQIDLYYQRCAGVQDIVQLYTSILREEQESRTQSKSDNYYMFLYSRYGERPTCRAFPWNEEEKDKFSHLFNLLRTTDWGSSDPADDIALEFGEKIFENITKKLSIGLHHLSATVPSLMDASCTGYHKASYFLAVMYDIGLELSVNPAKGLLYSLVGAQGDDRLSLLKLGYKHFKGIDNYPLDVDLSYAYYINLAKKTPRDQHTGHGEQAFVETIRLMDENILKEQTRENGDVFLWLKHEAARGDANAQHRLAQMLFWGQQGVSKNTKAAAGWYEKGALENEDPVIMYDYALVLFKGHGVRKNRRLALELMKKAAAKGQHQAFNGLGWYYHTYKKDFAAAAKYWRKAYEMGNVDAAFNLGVLHLDGIYPGDTEKNETRAFEYISKASEGGHIEGAIQCSQYLITGSLKSVPRDPETAVLWAKHVAEQNGHIGHVMRKALNAYLEMSLPEALLYYTLTAEAGIEMSQTNLAYLCEERPELTTTYLRDSCVWRYYNLSVHQNNAPTFAFLKMGDLYYYSSRNQPKHLEVSMWMYTQAALQGDSQGFFNLAQLIQEGVSIPEYILGYLQIEKSVYTSNQSLMVQLYERCQSYSSEESFSPCSLALLYYQIRVAWDYSRYSSLIYVLGSLLLSILVAFAVQCFHSLQANGFYSRRVLVSQNSSSTAGDSTDMPTPEQQGSFVENVLGANHSERGNTGLPRWDITRLIRTMKQTLRRHREVVEWLVAALGITICVCYVSFLIHSM